MADNVTLSQAIEKEWGNTPEPIRNVVLSLNQQSVEMHQQLVLATQHIHQLNSSLAKYQTSANASILQRSAHIAARRPRHPNLVVFICDTPSTRQAKLAYGLKRNGWQVILLHRDNTPFAAENYFIECQRYTTPEEAALLASLYSPIVFHVFSSWNFSTAAKIIEYRPGKIVFDTYDLFAETMQPKLEQELQEQIQLERYCIEHADGLCERALFSKHLKSIGYRIPEKRIFFPELCWDGLDVPLVNPELRDNKELHIAFVGNFDFKEFYNDDDLGVYNRKFIQELTAQKVHYHFYPPNHPEHEFNSIYSPYIELSKSNPYFHFHRHIAPENLIQEISKYHLGMGSYSRQAFYGKDKNYKPIFLKYFTANKVFDYIDAGLGVMTSCSRFMRHMLCSNGVGILAHKEDYPEVLKKISIHHLNNGFQDQVAIARRKLSVWRHAPKLINFYQQVHGKEVTSFLFDMNARNP